jgi:precorrin-6B methylase 2
LQGLYDEFEKRDIEVIAVAQEDTDLETHGKMAAKFKPAPRFNIVADLNGEKTTAKYKRVTAYYIDKSGTVRQIFPMMIHFRPSWRAVLGEIDRLSGTDVN